MEDKMYKTYAEEVQEIIITNPYGKLLEEKQWKCKGKHQYRLSKTEEEEGVFEWVCQCGKILNTKQNEQR